MRPASLDRGDEGRDVVAVHLEVTTGLDRRAAGVLQAAQGDDVAPALVQVGAFIGMHRDQLDPDGRERSGRGRGRAAAAPHAEPFPRPGTLDPSDDPIEADSGEEAEARHDHQDVPYAVIPHRGACLGRGQDAAPQQS